MLIADIAETTDPYQKVHPRIHDLLPATLQIFENHEDHFSHTDKT